MDDNMDSIMPLYELNKDGNKGGLIDYDMKDEDQLLGVFLKFQYMGDLVVGKFYNSRLPTKLALIEMEPPTWLRAGALIKFSRKEYGEKMETSEEVQFSKVSFKYLDHTPFYQRINTNFNTKKFYTKLVNSEKTEFKSAGKRGYLSFDHFIFGRVLLNIESKDLCQQSYQSVTVEGNIPSDSKSYDNMSFTVNFDADKEPHTVAKNKPTQAKAQNRSFNSKHTSSRTNNFEKVQQKVVNVETKKEEVPKVEDRKPEVDKAVENVVKKTESLEVTKESEKVEDAPSSSEQQPVTDDKIVDPSESEKKHEESSTDEKSIVDEPGQEENAPTGTSTSSGTKEATESQKEEVSEASKHDEEVVAKPATEQKNEQASSSTAPQNQEAVVAPPVVDQPSSSNAPQNNEINLHDNDTMYGILWDYVIRSSEDTQIRIFCIHMEKRFALIKVPTNQALPIGGLVRFSKSEYALKKVKLPRKEAFSTAEVTYIPGHGLFEIRVQRDDRHQVSLHNYKITSHSKTPEHYEFVHDLFGVIEDKTKMIRNIAYDKIMLNVIKPKDSSKNMKFQVFNVFETVVDTEEEREIKLLPMEERKDRLPELLRIQQQVAMEEETRKWEAVGVLVVRKIKHMGGFEGDVPHFLADKSSSLVSTILSHKMVSVYLVKQDDEEQPDSDNIMLDDLPYGLIHPDSRGFRFVPNKKFRNMVFEIGDRYKFLPKLMERSIEYFEKSKYTENTLFQHIYDIPAPEAVDSVKLRGMYKSEKIGDDPELLGDEYILNDQQKKAVKMALNDSRKIVLIHGPPGTGKTSTLAELIVQYVLRKQKILVIAPTNCAINNVFTAAQQLLVDRGITNPDEEMPLLITYEKVLDEASQCGLMKDLEDLKQLFENGEIDQKDHDIRRDNMISYMMQTFFETALVCLSTTNNSFIHIAKRYGFKTSTAIVDEAGMVLEAHLWNALHSMKRIIMAGDPKQLPALVKLNPGEHTKEEIANFQMSVMERLMLENENNHNYVMLDVQYRMHPAIMKIASDLFYEEKLVASESVKNSNILEVFGHPYNEKPYGFEQLRKPVVFCDTATMEKKGDVGRLCFDKLVYLDQEQHGKQKPSYCNPGEAFYVIKYVEMLLNNNVDMSMVSIITPYKGQVIEIQKLMNDIPAQKMGTKKPEVGTIDAFQGKENEIVIVSLVRNNPKRSIGFLLDDKRFNVLLTRAKKQLFLIGHSSSILFNNRGKLPQLSEILQRSQAVICRSLLNKQYYHWEPRQLDKFGVDFRDYLAFNPDDEKMKVFVKKFLEAKKDIKSVEVNDDEEDIE